MPIIETLQQQGVSTDRPCLDARDVVLLAGVKHSFSGMDSAQHALELRP